MCVVLSRWAVFHDNFYIVKTIKILRRGFDTFGHRVGAAEAAGAVAAGYLDFVAFGTRQPEARDTCVVQAERDERVGTCGLSGTLN